MADRPNPTATAPPDPGQAGSLDQLVEQLRALKLWAGAPSYELITSGINRAWKAASKPAAERARKSTVADCFRTGRRRLNIELALAVVEVLHPDVGYVAQWRQALRVASGEAPAASQVRVQDTLPQDLASFTGRSAELEQLVRRPAGTQVIAIDGMVGVGKTQLAIYGARQLAREKPFDRILFVNLRGFQPDPTQPPADPAAVLDGFLRLLDVPGQQIPHTLEARVRVYRERLSSLRGLVILDNAADEEQAEPLLPRSASCLTLITSRRSLALPAADHLSLNGFTPDEALDFLNRAVPEVPVGADAGSAARIALRCSYLPLALSLLAGSIRASPGWTLTDHAHRLDERIGEGRLDAAVRTGLDVSYRHLPPDRKLLLRLTSLHPGHDLDVYGAAALCGTELPITQTRLELLVQDNLLQQTSLGRYTFHPLVHVYARTRTADEDRLPVRRGALIRLFEYYLTTSTAALDAGAVPRTPLARTPMPNLTNADQATAWLAAESQAIVAVAAHAAAHGWPTYAAQLSEILVRYLASGVVTDPQAAARLAHANRSMDAALVSLGISRLTLGQLGMAGENLRHALAASHKTGATDRETRALNILALVERRRGVLAEARDLHELALAVFRQRGGRFEKALNSYRLTADVLNHSSKLGVRPDHHGPATEHLEQALALWRQVDGPTGEACALKALAGLDSAMKEA